MDDIRHLIPSEQRLALSRKSDARGAWALAVNWALIAFGFALPVLWPHPLGVLAGLVILGGRILGLGILMHDAAHRSLFASARANGFAGQWLCAAPIAADLLVYRRYHMTHHREAGSDADPDLPNYRGYPVARASFARKLLRDVAGLTGLRAALALGLFYAHERPAELMLGFSYRRSVDGAGEANTASGAAANPVSARAFLRNMRRVGAVQLAMFALLWACGHPLVYLMWPAAWLTSYMLFSRIRNAAEHGGLPGTLTTDVWQNTRSVRARWWERLTVAPNHVNWHFEHHLAPTVPGWKLRELHGLLAMAELPRPLPVRPGYGAVIRELIKPAP
ncbi:MAG: fatty acid desaturase family protein [Pelomonas sp.]|nr:fatty acid desaturase family protein [Roseateles sp.]